jgi:hypothetical protein
MKSDRRSTVKSQVVGLAVAIASLGLIASSSGAQANMINGILNLSASTSGGVTLAGSGGTTVHITIVPTFSGPGSFDATDVGGTWTIGVSSPSPMLTAIKSGGAYAIMGAPTSSFTYTDNGGSLTGNITFTSIRDDSPNPTLVGLFTGTGTGDLFGTYANNHFDMIMSTISFASLDALVAANGSQTVGSSSGEIEGLPGPITGAGLPGLVAACIGMLFLGQRRRRQLAA